MYKPTFEPFKIIYLLLSLLSSGLAFWRLRKQRDDLTVLSLMTVVIMASFFALYLDSEKDDWTNDVSEIIFRTSTHVNGDLILVLCNTPLWGAVPFATGIIFGKLHNGTLWVWLFFVGVAVSKAWFDDYFFIHSYPQELPFHQFESGYVLFNWPIIYLIAALFITKGRKFLEDQ